MKKVSSHSPQHHFGCYATLIFLLLDVNSVKKFNKKELYTGKQQFIYGGGNEGEES